MADQEADVIIVGAGAAGLATAVFAGRRLPGQRIVVVDGAKKIGAKILVSGGGRCNVTNVSVKPTDYWGGSRNIIRNVLAAFDQVQTAAFFREIGVEMYEEPDNGKLFPITNDANTVLQALLRAASEAGVTILADHRVTAIERNERGFEVATCNKTFDARCVVLATGGQSLPKTGSDGAGYRLAQQFGHTIVPITPALAPLLLDDSDAKALSGIAHDVALTINTQGEKPVVLIGAMLFTHFGVSGPVVLDSSRHWHRAELEGKRVAITVSMTPTRTSQQVEEMILSTAVQKPKSTIHALLCQLVASRVAEMLLHHAGVAPDTPLAHLPRDARARVVKAITAWPLRVTGSRGYTYAEVTAGGIPLAEIDASTMQSRIVPGLFLVGEVLDVDGRIGGFNFQWAWSGGYVAARGLEQRLSR